MACVVRIPAPLLPFTGGERSIRVEGETVEGVLEELGKRHEGLLDRICDGRGGLRSFVNLYINDKDIRGLDGLRTAVGDGDEIFIVPAIAGG